MNEPQNGTKYRIERIETDIRDLRTELREARTAVPPDYEAVKERILNLSLNVKELRDEVQSLRRALITTALSVTTGAVIFFVSVFQVFG